VEQDLARWVRFYFDSGGAPGRLTASSDAAINSPATLLAQLRSCVLEHGFTLDQLLPIVTSNTARVLKLSRKGRLDVGADADVLVMRRESLEPVALVARGRVLMKDGRIVQREAFLAETNRRVNWYGTHAPAHEVPLQGTA
jgi:beta-aspartyl-dipeptidase (metallo-type)